MRALILAFGLSCVALLPAGGQVVSQSDCATAAASVRGQRLPALDDTTTNAWTALAFCDTVGVSAALYALQTVAVVSETDSARILQFMALFGQHRSIGFLAAWEAVILNAQASDFFKRRAIREYADAYLPGFDFTAASVTAPGVASCGVTTASGPVAGLSPRPDGATLAHMISTLTSAAMNGGNSIAARGLAHCWVLMLQLNVAPVGSLIHGAYVCGNTFTITNDNSANALIHADVIPPSALQHIEFHTSSVAGEGGIWTFPAQLRGNLRITFNGAVIQTVVNTGTVCH